MSKIIIWFILFQSFLFANLEDDVKNKCLKEYMESSETISKYLVRMEDDIDKKGCNVIPIYASIIETNNFDILDELEENDSLMEKLLKIFYINQNVSDLFFKNSSLKIIILNNSLNEKFIKKFSYILKKELHKKDIYKIKKDANYLNYYILSSFYSKDKSETIKLFKKMKKSISLELLPSFSLILSAVGDEYKFNMLLESFITIQKELSIDAIKGLANYPKYFIYLLYPQKVDLDIGTVSDDRLIEVQKDIQRKALFLYQTMYEQYRYEQGVNQTNYALLSVEYIYPYLLEQENIDYDDFLKIFNILIKKDYLVTLFTEDKCSNKSKENFAIFGQNNIININRLLKNNQKVFNQLVHNLKNDKHPIFSLFYVANFYNTTTPKEWILFKELLKTLPYDYSYRIAFLKRLEINGYFRNIITQDDYRDIVEANDGTTYPKYKYILVTPYPSKNDETLFSQILTTDISDDKLKDSLLVLMKKDTDELSTHTFTTFDKFARGADIVNKIDDTFCVIAIVSAPFTGGVSLSYVAISAAKKVAKKSAKKGFNAMMKKVVLKSRKVVNKGIRKVRVVRKTLNGGVAGVKNVKKAGKSIDKTENVVGNINSVVQISTVAGSSLYLYLNNSEISINQICEEK